MDGTGGGYSGTSMNLTSARPVPEPATPRDLWPAAGRVKVCVYDGDGKRIKKTEGGSTVVYPGRYYEKIGWSNNGG